MKLRTRPDQSTRCEVCRYDLTGLPVDALCPECGTPGGRQDKGKETQLASTAFGLSVLALLTSCVQQMSVTLAAIAVVAAVAAVFRTRPRIDGLGLVMVVSAGVFAGAALLLSMWLATF